MIPKTNSNTNDRFSFMHKLSVIVPIYKVEKYIERCCRSLFGQTLDDIEYVFVDDCSPDRSVDILLKTLEDFPNRIEHVKIIHNRENLGLPQTRRKGINACTGEYIIHCDSDDRVDLTAYEKMYSLAKKNNLDIVSCGCFRVEESGLTHKCDEHHDRDILKMLLLAKKQGRLWNCLVKSSIVKNPDIIDPSTNMAEDLVLVIQYYFYARSFDVLNEPLYYYNFNPQSLSFFSSKEKLLTQAIEMSKNKQIIESFLIKANLQKQYSKEIIVSKFFDKRWILPAIRNVKDCSLWLDIHPDINISLYTCPYLSLQDFLTSLLVELRLYPLLRKFIRRR